MKPPHMLVSWAENIVMLPVLVAFRMINQSRTHKTEWKKLHSFGSAVKIQNIVQASNLSNKSCHIVSYCRETERQQYKKHVSQSLHKHSRHFIKEEPSRSLSLLK